MKHTSKVPEHFWKSVLMVDIDTIPLGAVEYCWSDSKLVRIGYDPNSDKGLALYSRLPKKWQQINGFCNIGSNIYDLGRVGRYEIISAYAYLDGQLSKEVRQEFNIPLDIVNPPWFGIKYCPDLDYSWLKVSDVEYSKYKLPILPNGAEYIPGVGCVYSENDTQPSAHNDSTGKSCECPFMSKDHKSVREWCKSFNVPDPHIDLPNTLPIWGVYSITYRPETLEILRFKFYNYDNQQRYEMEMYLDSLLEGRKKGLSNDEASPGKNTLYNAVQRVKNAPEFNLWIE